MNLLDRLIAHDENLKHIFSFYAELNEVYVETLKAMGTTTVVSKPASSAHASTFFTSS